VSSCYPAPNSCSIFSRSRGPTPEALSTFFNGLGQRFDADQTVDDGDQGRHVGGVARRRDISCNGGGEATAGELQSFAMRPIARSTPDRRHRTAPDEHPDMRLKSADQSMITDVSRLRPHLCTITTSTAPTQIVGEDAEPRLRRLTRDIRANSIFYSITSSASERNDLVSSPSALAVVRLMTSSNFVGCSTGRSPGFVPRSILSTYSAARRN
jgi:hypothetical protein